MKKQIPRSKDRIGENCKRQLLIQKINGENSREANQFLVFMLSFTVSAFSLIFSLDCSTLPCILSRAFPHASSPVCFAFSEISWAVADALLAISFVFWDTYSSSIFTDEENWTRNDCGKSFKNMSRNKDVWKAMLLITCSAEAKALSVAVSPAFFTSVAACFIASVAAEASWRELA